MAEFRRDPISGQWSILAEDRSLRPDEYSRGAPASPGPSSCPFCEGEEARTPPEVAAVRPGGGAADGPGWIVRSIPNRYPTLTGSEARPPEPLHGPFRRAPGVGVHEVIVMTPEHSASLASLDPEQARSVFRFLRERVRALESQPLVAATILFENRGPESGGTLTHPHAQLVATPVLPPRLVSESEAFQEGDGPDAGYCVLERVVQSESEDGSRMVSNDGVLVAFAPFASEHPYEVWIVPRRHTSSFADASDSEVDGLADLLPGILRALDAVRPGASYNWIVHGLRPDPRGKLGFHWHLELVPRLVRPDGFEVGGGIPVNPVSPERAADELRSTLADPAGRLPRKR
jgi:UDPglucose--hexose-1-phosphate uridylyltransferase